MRPPLPPAVRAFDATAPRFDERFGGWLSVAAQRRAVRRELVRAFRPGARLLELGAGTGEDALYMLARGYRVTPTDGSARMVELADAKIRAAGYAGIAVEQVVLEELDAFADRVRARGLEPFDGVYSNFAALNCVEDLRALAAPMGRLVREGGSCVLVVFGRWSPVEVLVEVLRGRPRSALRRLGGGPAAARLGGEHFSVWYPSPGDVARALAPWFLPIEMRGIGVLVPPSGAEPFVSHVPGLVAALEAGDRLLSRPLARLGDHVLLRLERTPAR